jgi:sugar phosphate isomerase/epimerase
MSLKAKFPFRLGAPSYVIAGDISRNVDYLSGMVDDIELVLFESDEVSPLPDEGLISTLRQTGLREGLTFTVHLPLDIWLGDSNKAERIKSVGKCLRVMERVGPLNPFGYVLHCNRKSKGDETKTELDSWRSNIGQSIDELLLSGISPSMLCIETLDYPLGEVEPVINEKKLGICLDIGHILLNNFPLEEYLVRHFGSTRIIHLHGIKEGRDHCDISALHPKSLAMVLDHLNSNHTSERVASLEVFNPDALNASLSVMERYRP